MRVASAAANLLLIPLLNAFLLKVIAPRDILGRERLCFDLLQQIIDILSLGSERAVHHAARLKTIIQEHNTLFTHLYPDAIKPKFHQLYHVMDHFESTGKLLSCWVTERKHRDCKNAALYAFRNIESTVARSIVLKHAELMQRSEILYKPCYLINPKKASAPGAELRVAKACHSAIGEIHCEDMILYYDGSGCKIARAMGFVEHSECVTVIAAGYDAADVPDTFQASGQSFLVRVSSVAQNLIWVQHSPTTIFCIISSVHKSSM